jgi:hypothetical protein
MSNRDVGVREVDFVYQQLQIEAGWSEPRERGFTWWPGTFAQSVWA